MNDIVELAGGHPVRTFGVGEVLIREGEARPNLYILVDGTVSVFRGEVRVSSSSTRGAFFGEMSVLLDMPSSASVITETPVQAVCIEDGRTFLASQPAVALHAASLLAQRLYDATSYLADLKRQFESETSHLGMVDRVLGSLLNKQLDRAEDAKPARQDPRL